MSLARAFRHIVVVKKLLLLLLFAAVPALASVTLSWDYPEPVPFYIRFQVWSTPDLSQPFELLTTTTNLSVTLDSADSGRFFKVRAENIITGGTSDWATTK